MADADFAHINPAEATINEQSGGAKPPLDLSHHFSRVTVNRKQSSIKSFYKYFAIPGIGNLAGGKSDYLVLDRGQQE
jgi:site-specific recombinase XerD